MAQIDYKKVFSKLSHIKALSHDNKFDQIVQNIIMLALNQADYDLKSESDVSKVIVDIYGISIRELVIQSNIDKLISSGDVTKDRINKNYIISQSASNKINQRITEANNLEINVKEEWFIEIRNIAENSDNEKLELLWLCLKSYLSNVFEQHGIQTIHLFNPNMKINEDDEKGLSYIIDKVIRDNNYHHSKELLIAVINQFIIKADEKRTNYISQLADATFTSFALTSDSEIVSFLNNRYNNLELFLDTNFIFGILDLHKNSQDSSAKEIIEEIRKNRLPFKLYYHPETLAEFKRAFDAKALHVKASKWTRESSRIAITVEGLSPLEELFHTENLANGIDPSIFLEKYEYVDLMLKDFGLNEYIPPKVKDNEHAEIEEDIDRYQRFYSNLPSRKKKSFLNYKHDILVLREVRNLNPKKTKFLDSTAFFISSDFVLAKFEKTFIKKSWEISYVVNPSVFLQLIRPFIQKDYTINKKFVDTFSVPEFRSFEIDYSTTRSKALQILNDSYNNTSFETKVRILRDQVLLEKLERVSENHDKVVEIIENQIAIENEILARQKSDAEENIKIISKENNLIREEKTLAVKEVDAKKQEISTLKTSYEDDKKRQRIRYNKELIVELSKSINAAEKVSSSLEDIIDDKMKNCMFILSIMHLAFFITILFLIYKLGWNSMEPITYIIALLPLLANWLYFAIKGNSFDYHIYFEKKRQKVREKVHRDFHFDNENLAGQKVKVDELKNQIDVLENFLEER